jgi:hypothetical protein
MAVTGIVFLPFLIAHMIGNLKVFYGKADCNAYPAWLPTMGAPAVPHRWALTILEIVLAACVLLHIGSAAERTLRARRARPVRTRRSVRRGCCDVVSMPPRGQSPEPWGVVSDPQRRRRTCEVPHLRNGYEAMKLRYVHG